VQQQQQQQQQPEQPSAQQLPQGGAAVFSGVPAGGTSQVLVPRAQPTLPQHIGTQQPAGVPAQQALQQQFQPFGAAGPSAMDAAQQAALLQQLQWQRMSQWQNGGVGGLPAFPHQQQQQQAALALLLQQQQQQQQQQAAAGSTAPPAAASAPQGIGTQHPGVSTPLDVQQQQALLQQLQAAQQRQQQAALLQQLQASQRRLQGQQLQQTQQQQPASVAQLPPQFQGQQVTGVLVWLVRRKQSGSIAWLRWHHHRSVACKGAIK
jgi:transcription factor SPT20